MSRLTQIYVLFVTILWSEPALFSPLFESINIERKINIDFKPLKFSPITFIKEKWGPFGKFIKKHTIERRDLDDIMNSIDNKVGDVKPVEVERLIPVIEKEEPFMGPLPPFLPPVKSIIVESNSPAVSKLNTDISDAIPVKASPVNPIPVSPYFTPVSTPEINQLAKLGAVPIVGSAPIEGPLLVPVTPNVVTQPVVPSSSPPPPPPTIVELPPGSRFGAFARFFGEILSEIVNRLIARARLSFSQFANQPAAA